MYLTNDLILQISLIKFIKIRHLHKKQFSVMLNLYLQTRNSSTLPCQYDKTRELIMSYTTLLSVVLISLLTSCSSSNQITKPSSINAISIEPNVYVTDTPLVIADHSPYQSTLIEFEHTNNWHYKQLLKYAGIDVGKIALDQFKQQIAKHPLYANKLSENGKFYFKLSVVQNWLIQQPVPSYKYAPFVSISVELISPEGTVVASGWQQSCIYDECVSPDTINNFRTDPELLKQQYRQASNNAIAKILKSL